MKTQISPKNGTVRIIIRTHTAFLPPEIRDLVVPFLEHTIHRFRPGGPQGYHHELQTVKFYKFDEDGWLVVGTGLVPRIQEFLHSHGLQVTIDDRTIWSHFDRKNEHLRSDAGLNDADIEFLDVMHHHPGGQIVVQSATQIAWYITLLGRYFPDCNIYIVAKNHLSAQQLVRRIKEFSDRPVTGDTQAVWSMKYRMLVAVVKFFNHCILDAWHILVFADPESASTEQSVKQMAQWQDNTRYCLISSESTFTDYERFRLEEVCGPVIFSPIENNPLAKMNVVFLDVEHQASTATDKGLTRKRKLIWHSESWNRMIVKTAMALARSNITSRALQKADAPGLPDFLRQGYRQTVSILVESSEHGRELLKQLPRWELRTLNNETNCIPAVDHQQIATFAYAERWGIGTDILLRADGGSGWPLSSGFPRLAQHQDDLTFLIDINDAADETAARDTQSRRDTYKQLDWDIVTVDSGLIASGMEDSEVLATKKVLPLDQSRVMETQERTIPTGQFVRTGN